MLWQEFLIHLLLTAVLLGAVAWILPGIKLEGAGSAILGALALGLINAVIRPVAVVLSIPLLIITLGLFYFLINAVMLMLAAAVVPGFRVDGCGSALLGSLLLSLLNWIADVMIGFP